MRPAPSDDDFPFVAHDHVRFRDLDASQHVNNAVYATYLEQARAAILGDEAGFILGRLEIDFRDRAWYGQRIEVRSRCKRVGLKSFDLEHRVFADGQLVAEGKSVVIAFDNERNRSVEVTDEVRAILAGDQ